MIYLIAAGPFIAPRFRRESLTDAEQQTMLDAAMNEVLNWKCASPTSLLAAEQLELSAQQLDELFIYAHALEL